MVKKIIRQACEFWDKTRLPAIAKEECQNDHKGLPSDDPGIEAAIKEGIGWLARAQDNSKYKDGGAARHYSLLTGWASSYPETTGYIIPTLLEFAELYNENNILPRARRMLDWLVSIQLTEGGFQGGLIDSTPVQPVTFNTGQILMGLVAGYRKFGNEYNEPMRRAADWLVETQDDDGCWRRYPSPFAKLGEKTYDAHVAWGLFEAARAESGRQYGESGLKNIAWVLKHQRPNGWFEKCCLEDTERPLTHTLGYTLRGVIEAYRFSKDKELLDAACKTADGLLSAINNEGFMPGRLDSDWHGAVDWACITGTVQIAICWLLLYGFTDNEEYREAAFSANKFARGTMKIIGPPEIQGGIKGSFPVDGDYGKFEYLNWACKFFIDSNMLEKRYREGISFDL